MEKRAVLRDLTSAELREELINRLREQIRRNEEQNESLRAQIRQLTPNLTVGDAAAAPRSGSRTLVKNDAPLRDVIIHVLKEAGESLQTREIIKRVQAAGYRSRAANFATVVNFSLAHNTDLFERVERGVYRLRPNGESNEDGGADAAADHGETADASSENA